MALPIKIKMTETRSIRSCEMCKDRTPGPRWEFRFAQMVSDYVSDELEICRKCVYRESFGSKFANKAKKAKILDKLNYEFNSVPREI
jgi:hypothetical protein